MNSKLINKINEVLNLDVDKQLVLDLDVNEQKQIVEYLDFIYKTVNETSKKKIAETEQIKKLILDNQKKYGDNVVKTLGEVCKIDIGGTYLRKKNEYYENGNNLWVTIKELNGGYIYDTKKKITDLGVQNSSVKLFKKNTILFSLKSNIGKTAIAGEPLYTNEAIAGIISKNNELLNNKYLYYYLTINDFTKLGSGIIGNGSLNKKLLKQIKIYIPSLKRQKEIVKNYEFRDSIIKNVKKNDKMTKEIAEKYIKMIIKNKRVKI